MQRIRQRLSYLRFAIASAFIVTLVFGAFAFLGSRAAGGREEQAAGDSAAGLLGEPLLATFSDADTDSERQEAIAAADAMLRPLLFGDLRGARITGPGGQTLYAAGDALDGVEPAGGDGASMRRIDAGGELLVSSIARGGYSVDVASDASALDDTIASARAETIVTTIAIGIVVWLLAQAAFWTGTQLLAGEHARLTYLYDAGHHMRSTLDLHEVLTRLVQESARVAGGRYALVALFDGGSGEVMLRATCDSEAGTVVLHQRPFDEWFVRRVIATNSTATASLPATTAKQTLGIESEQKDEYAVLCVPLSIRDRVVGAVCVLRTAGRPDFGPEDVLSLEHLAAQAVTAVEQAILFAKVRTDAKELEASYDSTLKALMAALDAKDEVTEGHCERVARLTIEMAKHMRLPDSMMVHIERGALLHDVGKIGVPDRILRKPRRLSDSEWEAMRKHPLLAGLMVSKVGFLEPALPILLYHHEKYDGTGYPFGLAGENIPLEARIFSVIDAYDAMTSDRPYRAAMPHRVAMEEIRRHSGTQFDPAVVDAFEQLMAARPDLHGSDSRRVLGMHDAEEAAGGPPRTGEGDDQHHAA